MRRRRTDPDEWGPAVNDDCPKMAPPHRAGSSHHTGGGHNTVSQEWNQDEVRSESLTKMQVAKETKLCAELLRYIHRSSPFCLWSLVLPWTRWRTADRM